MSWTETGGDLNVRGEVRVVGGHGLTVDGAATVRESLTIRGDVTVDGGLTVAGITDLRPLVTSEVDSAEITENATLTGFNGFNILPVVGLTVTIPDLDDIVYIKAQLWMEHASAANVNLMTCIGATGLTTIGTQIAAGVGFVGAAGKETSPFAEARLAPHSPGDYQVYGYSDTAGNVGVVANASNALRVVATRVTLAA